MGNHANRLRSSMPRVTVNYALEEHRVGAKEGEPVVVACDLHIPNVDVAAVEQMFESAKKVQATKLIIMGDLYNNAQFSRHPPGRSWITEHFNDAREVAHEFLTMASEAFTQVHIMPGNHDQWWIKFNKAELGMRDLIQLTYPEMGRINAAGWAYDVEHSTTFYVSELPSCHLTTGNEEWFLTHPGQYSKITGRVAENFVVKHGVNVGVAHLHQLGAHLYNGHWAVSLGGLFQESLFDYLYERPKAYARWEPGCVILGAEDYPLLIRKR